MFEPFIVENRNGQKFHVTCERHHDLCWRLVIHSPSAEYAGDLLFEPKDEATVELMDFHIFAEFACRGVGTELLNNLQYLLRGNGFRLIVGICKSSHRPLSEKEKLAQWYARLGFTLLRESDDTVPGYMGTLSKNL